MREFTTAVTAELAADQSEDTRVPITTRIDGRPITLHPLNSSQLVVVAYNLNSGSVMENAAGILNAFFGMVQDQNEFRFYKQRLWDPSDPFGIEIIVELMKDAIAEWAGTPTQGSGVSASSPGPTGPASPTPPAAGAQPLPSAFGGTSS